MRLRSTSALVDEVPHGGLQVGGARPAVEVWVAFALPLAATVEDEDAVAVAREQHGMALDGGRSPRRHDHRGAVAATGTYQPRRVSPSAVLNAMSSRCGPSVGAGTAALEACVATYPNAIG